MTNSRLTVENQIMQPKAEYFDELVDRNLLTNFRETAKELECKPRKFVEFLIERKYIYRDKRGNVYVYGDFRQAGKNHGFRAFEREWFRRRVGGGSWYGLSKSCEGCDGDTVRKCLEWQFADYKRIQCDCR